MLYFHSLPLTICILPPPRKKASLFVMKNKIQQSNCFASSIIPTFLSYKKGSCLSPTESSFHVTIITVTLYVVRFWHPHAKRLHVRHPFVLLTILIVPLIFPPVNHCHCHFAQFHFFSKSIYVFLRQFYLLFFHT